MDVFARPLMRVLLGTMLVGLGSLRVEGVVHDAAVAVKDMLLADAATATATDATGAVWTFGVFSSLDGMPSVFQQKFADGACQGYFSGGNFDVPYCIVNTGTEPLHYGDHTGNLNEGLRADEVLMHPDAVGKACKYVGFRLVVPQAGRYLLESTIRDVCMNGDGVRVSIVTNGVVCADCAVKADSSVAVERFYLPDLRLNAGDAVSFIIDPCGNHGYDSTMYTFKLSDSVAELVADMGDLFRAATEGNAPTLPVAVNGLVFDAGVFENQTGDSTQGGARSFDLFGVNVAPRGRGFRFQNSNGLPYALVNIASADSFFLTPVPNGDWVRVGEIALHAAQYGYSYVSVKAPRDGFYRAQATFRDTFAQGGNTNNPSVFRTDGVGALGQIRVNHSENLLAGVYVGCEYWFKNATLTVDRFEMKAGDELAFCVHHRGKWDGDRTTLSAQLYYVGTEGIPPADILNVDIDGYQSADGEPAPTDTFSGRGRVGTAMQTWNSVSALDKSGTSFTFPSLKNAAGGTTGVSLGIESAEAIGFDRELAGNPNALFQDYIYTYTTPVVFRLSGLVAGAQYDIYVFSGFQMRAEDFSQVLTANGVTGRVGSHQVFDTMNADSVALEGVVADENGQIIIQTTQGRFDAQPFFLNGFQLVGKLPLAQ